MSKYEKLKPKILLLINEGKKPKEIIKELGLVRHYFIIKLREWGIDKFETRIDKIPKSQVDFIAELVKKGDCLHSICKKTGKSHITIVKICIKNNIPYDFKKAYDNLFAWTKEEEDKLVKMFQESDRKMDVVSRFFKGGYERVAKKLRELGYESKYVENKKENDELIKTGIRRCSYCREIKKIEEFPQKCFRCSKCIKEVNKSFKRKLVTNDVLEKIILHRLYSTKTRAEFKKWDFDLDKDFLIELFNKQNGKCFYTNQDLELNTCSKNVLSIDRKDSNKGYTQDNVVLCCGQINRMKWQVSIEEFIKMSNLVSENFKKSPLT